MPEPNLYIPVLTGKAGEFAALRALQPDVRAAVRPVLDVPPVAADKDPADAIEKLVVGIGSSFGNEGHMAVDLLGLDGRLAGGAHPVDHLLERAEWGAARVQLAVRTDASPSYRQAVATGHARAAGICVRARIHEDDDANVIARQVDALLQELEVERSGVHLMLDCAHVAGWARRPDEVLSDHLAAQEDLDDFGMLSVAATAVPPNDEINRRERPRRVARREWTAWQRLARREGRRPSFGDYGITGPRPNAPPQGLPDPHLRYTTPQALLIWRGKRPERVDEDDDDEPTSFGDLCRELLDRSDFAGSPFSSGDAVIAAVAARERDNDGGASQWVEWATSHHITHVVRALTSGA